MGCARPYGASAACRRTGGRRGALSPSLGAARRRPLPHPRAARAAAPPLAREVPRTAAAS